MWGRISSDFIQARKEKNEVNKSILSLVYSALKNRAIELRVEELADQETISVNPSTFDIVYIIVHNILINSLD